MASFEISSNENNKVNLSNLNKLRNSNYFRPLINHGWEPNKTKRKKFSYNMNLENPIHTKYDIIYFFILYNYTKSKYIPGSVEHLDYIVQNIGGLLEEEKKSLCLLILKKISQDYFIQLVQSGFKDDEPKTCANFLIQILSLMGKKYLNIFIRNFEELLNATVNTKIEQKDRWYYLPYISKYIKLINSMINGNLPDNASSSKSSSRNYSHYPSNSSTGNSSSYSSKSSSGNSSRYSSKSSSGNSSRYSSGNSSIRLNTNKFKNLIQKIGLDYRKVNLSNKTYGNNKQSLTLAIKKTLLEVHSNKRNSKTVVSEINNNKLKKRIIYVKDLQNILSSLSSSSSGNKRKSRNNNNLDSYSKRGKGNNNIDTRYYGNNSDNNYFKY